MGPEWKGMLSHRHFPSLSAGPLFFLFVKILSVVKIVPVVVCPVI